MRKHISDYTLYRWRYILGYIVAALAITTVLAFAMLYVPGGLRDAERTSAIASGALMYTDFDPHTVINLPYHIMQRVGFAVLGISEISIKLPSVILGTLAVLGIFLLIREWFRANTALITAIITATTPLFLFVAQDGTPTIYAIAVSTWLLLIGTYVTRRRTPHLVWKVLFFCLFVLNLYAPLGLYLNLAIITTMIFHPHIRYLARRLNINKVAAGAVAAFVLVAPLLYSLVMHPSLGMELLGIPDTLPSIKDNIIHLGKLILGIYDIGTSPIAQPILSLGVALIVVIGVIRFIQIKYTARSYITWFWTLTLIPLIILNPNYIGLILPLMAIMIAMGIGSLISSWYKMFPRNPYARVAGLVPLTFIVVGLVSSSVARYAVSYHYIPGVVQHFDSDVRLLKQAVVAADKYTDNKVSVIVPENKREFYDLVAKYDGRFTATSSLSAPTPLIISRDHADRHKLKLEPVLVFTDRQSDHADRFYLYTSPQQ